jgi:hypothetical protein
MLRNAAMIMGGTAALAAALLATVAALAVVFTANAAVTELKPGTATVAPGGTVTVNVTADSTSPGIGAWGLNVSFDASVVDATSCTSVAGQCNPDFAAGTIRMNGATTTGIVGADAVLGTITFQAVGDAGDSSALTIASGFTLADPEGTAITVSPTAGSITIQATPTPSPTPGPGTPTPTAPPGGGGSVTATPTRAPTAGALPSTGGPDSGDSVSTMTWLLAASGLLIVASGAWAVARARREN